LLGDSVCDSQLDPNTQQYIVWGVGGLSKEEIAFQHFIRASGKPEAIITIVTPALLRW